MAENPQTRNAERKELLHVQEVKAMGKTSSYRKNWGYDRMGVLLWMSDRGASVLCVHNSTIVGLQKQVTQYNGKKDKEDLAYINKPTGCRGQDSW